MKGCGYLYGFGVLVLGALVVAGCYAVLFVAWVVDESLQWIGDHAEAFE